MLLFILKNAIISIILIFLLHYIYDYFKTNLTTPKVKDLVNKPQMQYKEIIESIKENNSINKKETEQKKEIQKISMKNELKQYMNDLNTHDDTPVSAPVETMYESF